jgi:tetratricopeptide (TPR) repeat protein
MTYYCVTLMFVGCFSLATVLGPRFDRVQAKTNSDSSILAAVMGDSRRMFANQFYSKADAYYHSGYYPTIFDVAKPEGKASHLVEKPSLDVDEDVHKQGQIQQPEAPEPGFLGKPQDWIERFGRNFFPTIHTHLHNGNEREILPWLKLSAEMDPQQVQTYVTAAYWLRVHLNKPAEAEQFLRQGLRANPDSYEILLELGRVYYYSKKDLHVARSLFDVAAVKWRREDSAGLKPEREDYEEILGELVRVEQEQNDLKPLLDNLEELQRISPSKGKIDQLIEEVKTKIAALPPSGK